MGFESSCGKKANFSPCVEWHLKGRFWSQRWLTGVSFCLVAGLPWQALSAEVKRRCHYAVRAPEETPVPSSCSSLHGFPQRAGNLPGFPLHGRSWSTPEPLSSGCPTNDFFRWAVGMFNHFWLREGGDICLSMWTELEGNAMRNLCGDSKPFVSMWLRGEQRFGGVR